MGSQMTSPRAVLLYSLGLNPPACRIWPGRNDFSMRLVDAVSHRPRCDASSRNTAMR